jgi:type VI secretion system FHA domain protein
MGNEELDPLKLLDPAPKRAPIRTTPAAKDLAYGSLLEEHYQPPAVVAPQLEPPADSPLIPQGYDPLAPEDATASLPPASPPVQRVLPTVPEPKPPSPPQFRRPQPPSAGPANPPSIPDAESSATGHDVGHSEFAAMLAAAGLDGALVTPELMRNFGQILRVVVSGLMDVLQSRQHIKDEFRIHMTQFRPANNNPLKFSANVDDALHNLLVKRNPAYLTPVEAFEDAFDDLRNHQIAMLAGLRVAFESILADFDADNLQQLFDRQLSKGSLLSVPAKLRYWDLYRDKCREMAKDPEASFRELFGEQFANAYEEQLKRLKDETARQPGKTKR